MASAAFCETATGIPEGPFRVYSPAGRVVVSGRYSDGEKTGKWQLFDADGSVSMDATYIGNRLDGAYTFKNQIGESVLALLRQRDGV